MINYLHGSIKIFGKELIIVTNGVGYGVEVGEATLHSLREKETVELFIHTHVREDEITLYGFQQPQQKQLFLQFINISGVGPRTAMHIVDSDPQAIITAVQQADVSFFSQFPRVGKKLAQKIIIELKTKLGGIKDLDLGPESVATTEVREALLSLGFSEQVIHKALQETSIESMTTEQALKAVLKKLK